MDKKSLAMAYAVKRKKMAAGGMVKKPESSSSMMSSPKSIASAVYAKKMAKGGMVEEDDEEKDDFLSSDMDQPEWGQKADMFSQDPESEDSIEDSLEEDGSMKKKKMLSKVFAAVSKRQTGQ